MNGSTLLIITVVYFTAAYFIYGRFLRHLFGIDPSRKTPAVVKNDGVDYAPARPAVLFGHHFASIAGAGPILGPIFAAELGWIPALLWIFLGCVFIGGLHDFAALFLSVRHEGKSISSVIEELVGYAGRMIFSVFCWAALALVVAMFGIMTAQIFVNTPSAATASVIFILLAPVFGLVLNRRILGLLPASLIFVPLTFLSVWVGMLLPADLVGLFEIEPATAQGIWLAVLGAYVFIASVAPVQWLLQPRDYLNSFLLYALLICGLLGILVCNPDIVQQGWHGLKVITPSGAEKSVIPTLFIVIACGACSGFHSLVASGTTSKQVASEDHIQLVGYGGMLLEGVLAVISLISVLYLSGADFTSAVAKPQLAFASGLAHFSTSLGLPEEAMGSFVSLVLAAFMMTTLDTATRLGRFVWQEILSGRQASPAVSSDQAVPEAGSSAVRKSSPLAAFLRNPYVATFIMVGMAATLCVSGQAGAIWPVFGASNQLLAALCLLGVTLYLLKQRRGSLVAFIPMSFMIVMSCWGLGEMTAKGQFGMLQIISASLLALTLFLVILAIRAVIRTHQENRPKLSGTGN